MADDEYPQLVFPAVQLELLDVTLQAVLAKRDSETRDSIEEELTSEFEVDKLLEEREKAFSVARGKFENVLVADGLLPENDKVDITVANKTNKSGAKNIAKDIIDMYDYIVGHTQIFPKTLISKESKYIDISKKDSERGSKQIYNPVLDRMRMTELANTMRDLQSAIDKLVEEKKEDRKKIVKMEQEIVALQGQVNLFSNQNASENTPGANTIQEPQAVIPNNNKQEDKHAPSIITTKAAATAATANGNPTETKAAADDLEPKNPVHGIGRRTVVQGSNGEIVTVIHRGPSLTKDIVDQVLAGKQPTPQKEEWPSLPIPKGGPLSQHSIPHNDRRPSSHNNEKQIPDRTPNFSGRQSRGLRGVRQEKGSSIYIRSIQVEDESDEEIGQMVREHCKQYGIRVMNYRIIRYKAVSDVLGCRITVPQSQEHLALEPSNWPEAVEVRRWEPAGVYYKKTDKDRDYDRHYSSRGDGYRGEDEPYPI